MRRMGAILFTLLIGVTISSVRGEIIINEVMSNEPGGNTNLEWVELLNRGDTVADLGTYLFVEGGDTTRFEALLLGAGEYVVLARKIVAEPETASFESWWGDGSGEWGDSEAESFPVVEVPMSLRNSDDEVRLIDLSSGTEEIVSWTTAAPDGVSLERRNPRIAAVAENFAYCQAETGASPGAANSILAPAFDLGLTLDSLGISVADGTRGKVEVYLTVANWGRESIPAGGLQIVLDSDLSKSITPADSLWEIAVPSLLPGEEHAQSTQFECDSGRISLLGSLPPDDNRGNNEFDTTFALGIRFRELVINELQLNSAAAFGGEWLELKNIVPYPVNTARFQLGPPGLELELEDSVAVLPGEVVVICQDSHAFMEYAGSECYGIELRPWVGLDDGGAVLRLVSDLNTISDSVEYLPAVATGVSWERDDDTTGESFLERYYPASVAAGATPCNENSERNIPPLHDLALNPDSVQIEYVNEQKSVVRLRFLVENRGLLDASSVVAEVFDDRNLDGESTSNELVGTLSIVHLQSMENTGLWLDVDLHPGYHQLLIQLPADDHPKDNRAGIACSAGPMTGEVIVTEYLANPADEAHCEWVELQNLSNREIDLSQWQFGDAVRLHTIEESVSIEPGEYLLLTAEPECGDGLIGACQRSTPSGWSSLNNSGDLIRLVDRYGVVSDSFTYSLTAPDNRSIELNQDEYAIGTRAWYPATSAEYSSPCEANSVSGREEQPIVVALPQRVFSPGRGEGLAIEILCPPATPLTLVVYDLAGRKHRAVAEQQLFSNGVLQYRGESDITGTLRTGAYVLTIEGGDGNDFATKLGFAVAPPR